MGVKKTLRPIYAKYMTKFTKDINLLITGHKLACRASIGKSSFNVSQVEDNRLSLFLPNPDKDLRLWRYNNKRNVAAVLPGLFQVPIKVNTYRQGLLVYALKMMWP